MERNLRRSIVNYSEMNTNEDGEMDVSEVIDEIHSEQTSKADKQTRKRGKSKEELNKTRQYKKTIECK